MAYTDPPTFVADDVLEAAQLNAMGDDIRYLYGISQGLTASGVQVQRTSSQSISDSSATEVSFQSEQFDFGGWWSSGTDVIVPAGAIPAGYTTIIVLVADRMKFATSGTGNRRAQVLLNGAAFGTTTVPGISGDPTDFNNGVDFVEVAAGDVITLEAYQTSGGSLNLSTAVLTVMRYQLGS